jgi:hypothetical protein
MAKTRYTIKKATQDVLKELSAVGNSCAYEVERSVRRTADEAAYNAVWQLISSDHRQRDGDKLAKQIGVNHKDGVSTVYAPVTNTQKWREQMYFAEYGTGYHHVPWGYYTTKNDKNPKKWYSKKYRRWISVVHESRPVGYMKAARRYLVANTRRDVEEAVRLVITRKPRNYSANPNKTFASNVQYNGSYLGSKWPRENK